jgi:hypothetical protein
MRFGHAGLQARLVEQVLHESRKAARLLLDHRR